MKEQPWTQGTHFGNNGFNTKWRDFKFYVHEIAAINLSKIYFLKTQRKHGNQTMAIWIAIDKQSNKILILNPVK